jgi:DDE superfamily endonuclease
VQIAIDANTRLVVATGDPLPGNRNDCAAYRDSGIDQALTGRHVMADGAYQGNPGVIMPYRKPRNGGELEPWQEDLNAVHRRVRARVEHVLARMKNWKILRDHRRKAGVLGDTVAGVAYLHNLAATA